MLKIQVLGKGLIPRGHGLAPKKDPFAADLMTIGAILSTPGLSATYIHPEKNKALPLTRDNYQKVYKTYDNAHLAKKSAPEQKVEQKLEVERTDHIHTGHTTAEPVVEKVTEQVEEAAAPVEEKKEEVVAETKVEDFVVTPAVKAEEGNKIEVKVGGQSNNNNYHKNQNNNRNGNK